MTTSWSIFPIWPSTALSTEWPTRLSISSKVSDDFVLCLPYMLSWALCDCTAFSLILCLLFPSLRPFPSLPASPHSPFPPCFPLFSLPFLRPPHSPSPSPPFLLSLPSSYRFLPGLPDLIPDELLSIFDENELEASVLPSSCTVYGTFRRRLH